MEILLSDLDVVRPGDSLELATVTAIARGASYDLVPGTALHHHMVVEPGTDEALAALAESLTSPDTFARIIRTSRANIGALVLAHRSRDPGGLDGMVVIDNLMVLPRFQRLGAGGRLLAALEDWAGEDVTTFRTWVFKHDWLGRRRFYEANGYLYNGGYWNHQLGAGFAVMEKGEQRGIGVV